MVLWKTAKKRMAGLLLAAAVSAPAMAAVIDQHVAGDTSELCFGIGTGCKWEQQITPGLSGLLSGLQVYGTGNADLRFAYGSGPLSGGWAAQLLHVDIEHLIDLSVYGIYLTAGSPFVFELSNPDADGVLQAAYLAAGFPNKLYDGAVAGGGYVASESYSLAYTTTVERAPAAVPEPQTPALLLIGLALLAAFTAFHTRRRRLAAAPNA